MLSTSSLAEDVDSSTLLNLDQNKLLTLIILRPAASSEANCAWNKKFEDVQDLHGRHPEQVKVYTISGKMVSNVLTGYMLGNDAS